MKKTSPIPLMLLIVAGVLILPLLIFLTLCFVLYGLIVKRKLQQPFKKYMHESKGSKNQNQNQNQNSKGRIIDHDSET